METVLIIGLVALVAVGGFFAALASKSKRDYAAANEIVAGHESVAPAHWAGSHSPEAKMHRRLRDAVASLHADERDGSLDIAEARVAVEREALAVDERLIAAASLPDRVRGERVARLETSVLAVEDAVAAISDALSADALGTGLTEAVETVQRRVVLMAEARAEVESLDTGLSAAEVVERIRETPPEDDQGTTSVQ